MIQAITLLHLLDQVESAGAFAVSGTLPAIAQRFADAVQQRLQAEFSTPPAPSQDWSRAGQLACDCEFCTEVNTFLPKPNVASIGIYGTLKRNRLHVEDENAKQQIEAEIEIRKRAPRFDGTIKKNQRHYEEQRQLYSAAQEIVGLIT